MSAGIYEASKLASEQVSMHVSGHGNNQVLANYAYWWVIASCSQSNY